MYFWSCYYSCCVLLSTNLSWPPVIRHSVWELKMTGKGRSVSRCGPVHRQLAHTTTFWRWVAPRISNANAVAYFACSLTCAPCVSARLIYNQSWLDLCGSASKSDNWPRWAQEESSMWEGDRFPTSHLHQSIISLPIWFPSLPFAAIISDDIKVACGAQLHLEVKTALLCIKNTFLFPEPLDRGSISSRGSIWYIE